MSEEENKKSSKYVIWFKDLKKDSLPEAGGKGANMGEMVSIGMPVPGGFVVSTSAFEHFLESNKLNDDINKLISNCDVDDTDSLNNTSDRIKRRIMDADYPLTVKQEIKRVYDKLSVKRDINLPEDMSIMSIGKDMAIVAVRSSATTEDLKTASFAGQQASFLNVKGVPYLLDAVKRCWASLYEPRAIFYRAKKGFKEASIAVIVQRMVNADKAGVTFTIDPSSGEDVVIHEAAWGLGESLVLGKVNPDMYKVSKDSMEILEKNIGRKDKMHVRDISTEKTVEIDVPEDKREEQVLTEDEVKELTRHALKLEEHYSGPQDIEWAIERGNVHILQTRPVTTGNKEFKKGDPVKGADVILSGIAASPGAATGVVKIVRTVEESEKIEKGDVLVTEMTSPEFVPAMSKCVAIVTEKGGTTSHAAIVSREMGIPCIVGADDALKKLGNGKTVTVDGTNGIVYDGDVEIDIGKDETTDVEIDSDHKPKIYMNLGVPEKIDDYKDLPFEGIGLMRIEFVIAELGIHPKSLIDDGKAHEYSEVLKNAIEKVASAVHPRPVVVRFSDFKTNEYDELKGGSEFEPKEENPMLGWRGVSRFVSPEFEDVFRLECKAVKFVREKYNNVWVMLPFVRTVDETMKCMDIIEDEGLERGDDFMVWIMAEVPSVVFLASEFAKICDGISIGSNDLTQLVLGVDRDSEILNKLGYFEEENPAVKRAISQLIREAHENDCIVSICGQAPSENMEFIKFLVEEKIDSISVNPDVVEKVVGMFV